MSMLSSCLTSSQTVPPSAMKYNSLKRADLYQDGRELYKRMNLKKNLKCRLIMHHNLIISQKKLVLNVSIQKGWKAKLNLYTLL